MTTYAFLLAGPKDAIDLVMKRLEEEWPYTIQKEKKKKDAYAVILEFFEDVEILDIQEFMHKHWRGLHTGACHQIIDGDYHEGQRLH